LDSSAASQAVGNVSYTPPSQLIANGRAYSYQLMVDFKIPGQLAQSKLGGS
jgi:hypothetical protein